MGVHGETAVLRAGGDLVVVANMPAPEFVLDREENPHPRMLGEALLARQNRHDSTETLAYWHGYLAAMCGATGCPPDEIEAWMDHHEPGVPVEVRTR